MKNIVTEWLSCYKISGRESKRMSGKINWDKEKSKKAVSYAALVLIPALLFYLEAFFTYRPFERTRWRAQILNIVLLELIMLVLLMVIGNAVWALRIETVFVLVAGLANYYVISFRGAPIVPWDFLSLRTAASVAGGYSYVPGIKQVVLIVVLMGLVFAERYVRIKIDRKHWIKRLAAGASSLLAIIGLTVLLWKDAYVTKWQLYPFLFTPNVMYERNGFAVTFLMDLQYMAVEKPEGYDKEAVKELLEEYDHGYSWTGANTTDEEQELPNIIVVMNEAFSDLKVLGEFETDRDYMPFVHSLQSGAKNTVTGNLHVSVKGGNTANTEFEFLSGQTMAFLPAGSIPYQQYVTNSLPTMASYLQSLGYTTHALHPYYATGWNRDKVYPLFGFEEFLDQDAYLGSTRVRGYVDDMACTGKIIELYEKKEREKPMFLFQVTMQNHSPYTDGYQSAEGNITVSNGNSAALDEYLTLMQKSDDALRELVRYFEGREEKTVVVFFGDHQPTDSVVFPIYRLNGRELSEEEIRYEVPYVIWANYEIKEEAGADTSANYLGAEVLKRAGIPLSDYQNYLLDLKEEYDVISARRLTDEEREEEKIKEYQSLQYYLLFDRDENEQEE